LPGEIKAIADQPAESHRGRESEIRFEPPRRLTNHWPITSINGVGCTHRLTELPHVFPTGMVLLQTYNARALIKSIDLSRIA
jgi:hypothetical protein